VLAAARRGLLRRVEFIEAPAETFVDVADVVVCVASSHAFGDSAAALEWLRQCVTPGGRVLYGEGFWASDPSPAALESIGALPGLDELHAPAEAAGFRIEQAEISSQEEWDAFEAAWRSGLESSGDPEAVAFAAERKREYEDGYREAIGFAWLVLAPV
jgi:SAM-dependent methyltransferase